jgi:hypothetical protein
MSLFINTLLKYGTVKTKIATPEIENRPLYRI